MYFHWIAVYSCVLLSTVSAISYPCSCECCLGVDCKTSTIDKIVHAEQCNDDSCLAACRRTYYGCNVSPPHGQAKGRCLTTTTTTTKRPDLIVAPYLCRCECCNTGSYLCSKSLVGYATAYACSEGACSIACARQYPSLCVNDRRGQTQGTCDGNTAPPNGSGLCGCSCCTNNNCHLYEMVSSHGCSTCSSACQGVQMGCSALQTTYCR